MNALSRWLFDSADEPASRGTIAALAALYVAGLLGWAYVLGWGSVPLDFHDWTGINVPRLLFVQNALRSGVWPLHMVGGPALHDVTDRFLALPDVITSPQTLLLLVLPVQRFVLVDVLIQYSIGFAGLLALRRYARWSLFAFVVVFLLFGFNGHIVSHYSVGHFTWAAYFVFPWIVLFVLRFLDGENSWRLIAWFAAAMAYMVVTGGQHHMTWVLLLLVLVLPFVRKRAWWIVCAIVASGLLSAVRLLPPALELGNFRRAGLVSDVIGFPSVAHLLLSLAALRRETPAYNPALPGNIWFFDTAFYEFSAYIGIAGLLVLIVGIYCWLRVDNPRYRELIVPLFAMVALSIGSTYRIIRFLGIPLMEGERYTARLFSLPLTFMIVLAAGALSESLRREEARSWLRGLALAALAFIAIDMAASARLWRVAVSSGMFLAAPFSPSITTIVERSDPTYVAVVLAGVAISLMTASVLFVLAWRSRPPAR